MEDKPLLTIELDGIESVPRVYYKGEEVTKKVKVQFHWETGGDRYPKIMSPVIHIEHLKDKQLPWDNNAIIHHVGYTTPVAEEDEDEDWD
jgi:hypothetical protein